MKNKAWIIIVILILLVVGYFLNNQNKLQTQKQETVTTQNTQDTQNTQITQNNKSITGKITDLLTGGQSLRCLWKQDEANSNLMWLSGKNFAGEFVSQGKKGYMIYKDNCSWIWSEGEKQGVKMCYQPKENEEKNSMTDSLKGVPQDVNFNCQPETISASKFIPPTDVNFMDMSGLVKP